MHTFVFFIFIVANIAGSLTPLGDPPLFLGFLRGVDFFWTAEHLILPMLTAVGLLLALYFVMDSVLFNKEKDEFLLAESTCTKEPFGVEGKINFALLGVIIGAVLMAGVWRRFNGRRVGQRHEIYRAGRAFNRPGRTARCDFPRCGRAFAGFNAC